MIGVIVRLGDKQEEGVLLEPHVKKFDITGRPMKGWVLVGPEEPRMTTS